MSDNVNFGEYIASERERIVAKQREITEHQRVFNEDANQQLANLGREFAAIAAYEAAKTGKTPKPTRSSAAPRARRGSRREIVLSALSDEASGGMTRSELLDTLGVKTGDKRGEMSVSNALSALRKAGQVERRDGRRWTIVANDGLQRAAE